jgi:hypothetical protein
MKKSYADRAPASSQLIVSQPETLPATGLALLPLQRLYSSPGTIATDFSSVDIRMPIMNRHPTDQEEKAVAAVPAGATTCAGSNWFIPG